jgi:GT2 family glycosyltransferase
MPKVAINLVTWNGEKFIERSLNSILSQTFKDFLLLIIDNGSVDQTAKIIEEQFLPAFGDKIKFVKNKNNFGFAFAHNQALLWTASDYILVLNQDVILDPEFLEESVKFLETHHDVGSISGKVLRWELKQIEDLKNSEKSDIIDSIGLKIFKNHRVIERAAGEKDKDQYENITEIFGPSAACPVYRRIALNDIRFGDEFFDNDFFSYKEDIDLAFRLRWRGWKSYYLPEVVAYHKRTAKSREKINFWQTVDERKAKTKFINYHSYKNHLFVLVKNLSFKNFWRYFPRIFFYELKKKIYLLFFETATLKALKEFLSKLKAMKAKRHYIMSRRLIKDDEMRKWFN